MHAVQAAAAATGLRRVVILCPAAHTRPGSGREPVLKLRESLRVRLESFGLIVAVEGESKGEAPPTEAAARLVAEAEVLVRAEAFVGVAASQLGASAST